MIWYCRRCSLFTIIDNLSNLCTNCSQTSLASYDFNKTISDDEKTVNYDLVSTDLEENE